jgi:hypothetical protein
MANKNYNFKFLHKSLLFGVTRIIIVDFYCRNEWSGIFKWLKRFKNNWQIKIIRETQGRGYLT